MVWVIYDEMVNGANSEYRCTWDRQRLDRGRDVELNSVNEMQNKKVVMRKAALTKDAYKLGRPFCLVDVESFLLYELPTELQHHAK